MHVLTRVPIGPADEPVQDERLDQHVDVFLGASRVLAQEVHDRACTRTAIGLVLERRSHAHGLTVVLLMDPDDASGV
jgi:hypothetical protein